MEGKSWGKNRKSERQIMAKRKGGERDRRETRGKRREELRQIVLR